MPDGLSRWTPTRRIRSPASCMHSADACIGCQYCTWNCSYGVPQYNPERGVVGKCDMCHDRLADNREPACAACLPRRCDPDRDREDRRNGGGTIPPARTRRACPRPTTASPRRASRCRQNFRPTSRRPISERVRPEHPHWPLVVMTVLTQLSVGAFASIWLLADARAASSSPGRCRSGSPCSGSCSRSGCIHAASWAGRFMRIARLKMWRRSWLSREVLLFGCFSADAVALRRCPVVLLRPSGKQGRSAL